MPEYSKKLTVILPLLYTYDFGAPVWRLRLDAAANYLALEVRDSDLLLTDFYSLDLRLYQLNKLPLPAAKNWWLGLEDAHAGLLLLHGYGDKKVGEHKGIKAYRSQTGKLAWEQAALAFYGVTTDGILALDPEAQTLALLQPHSGTILQQNVSLENGAAAVANYSQLRYQHCHSPMLYLAGEPYFADVAEFLEAQLQVKAVRGIEYAETGKYIVISYYTDAAEGKVDNWLSVFLLDGEIKLNKRIASGLNGIGSDTFIIFDYKLYIIQDRNTLAVYNLI